MKVNEVNAKITEHANDTIKMLYDERLDRESRIKYALEDIKFLGYYIADRIRVGKKWSDFEYEEITQINECADQEIFRIYTVMQKI